MSNLMQSIDERTRLAGANRLEILLFNLGQDLGTNRTETFGINVFKVREVMRVPEITHAPEMPPAVEGMVSLRGVLVPVVDLAKFCGIKPNQPPSIMIVTEYNTCTQGFLVQGVENILRLEWSQMKVPPAMITSSMNGLVTAVTELQDGRIVMILDVEKILAEGLNRDVEAEFREVQSLGNKDFTVFFADDSPVARKQISATLEHLGVKYISANNGREGWEKLQALASKGGGNLANMVQLILTDVEMPEMDGYVLTKQIKADLRMRNVPVVMHSSLSSDANIKLAQTVGVDAYVPKFNPEELANILRPFVLNHQAA